MLDEIVKDAKNRKRTVHITFFDLADAFGSVPHNSILHSLQSLQRNHFPPEVIQYVNNFYKNIQAKVVTKSFQSEIFSFRRGVFQGDPLSPIIFLLVFNPILQFLTENSKFGYKLQEEKFITLPFADDFCLITTDRRTHQRMIKQIDDHINSMGMMLKPAKCRSFSIKGGKAAKEIFKINDHPVPSIEDEEQKFLGRVLFYSGKSSECSQFLKENIMQRIENLDKTAIRPEFKLEIYQIYILPSIRFLLTVHDLPLSHLTKLDTMVDQFLKKWAGLPRCATNAILHIDTALHIKKISTLYKETHATTHCSTRLKGDTIVNLTLDNRLVRESQYTRKQSITVQSEHIYQRALGRNTVQGEIPGLTPENVQLGQSFNDSVNPIEPGAQIATTGIKPSSEFISNVKNEAKSLVSVEDNGKMFEHIKNLVKQGNFLKLSKMEQNDATWKSYIYNLPKGTMKWLLNASIDTLPTRVNLKQWGKINNDKCFCGQRQTLNHILNCCTVSLNQGRFTYRHDSILNYIHKCLDTSKYTCYTDIQGYQSQNGGTIPPEILVTPLKTDIVIVDKTSWG